MDGIALYETVGAIFIIQLRGLQFSLFKIIVIRFVIKKWTQLNYNTIMVGEIFSRKKFGNFKRYI